jgi:hypothetical protein
MSDFRIADFAIYKYPFIKTPDEVIVLLTKRNAILIDGVLLYYS